VGTTDTSIAVVRQTCTSEPTSGYQLVVNDDERSA
jgi:hypothetical protein